MFKSCVCRCPIRGLLGSSYGFGWSVTAVIGAVVLLRGCPMCWLMGLFETLKQGRAAQRQWLHAQCGGLFEATRFVRDREVSRGAITNYLAGNLAAFRNAHPNGVNLVVAMDVTISLMPAYLSRSMMMVPDNSSIRSMSMRTATPFLSGSLSCSNGMVSSHARSRSGPLSTMRAVP
jgi:hypothetical protein